MAIEEEFGIEIPDAEADEITTVAQGEWGSHTDSPRLELWADEGVAIDYVAKVRLTPYGDSIRRS